MAIRTVTRKNGTIHLWPKTPLEDRLVYHSKRDEKGCLLWTGQLNHDGYGIIRVGKKEKLAHRAAYEHLVGAVPKGLELDHLCRVRHCINIDHLEPVSHAVNCERGTPNYAAAVKRASELRLQNTQCTNGHPYTEQSVRYGTDGRGYQYRVCKICIKNASAKAIAKRKLIAAEKKAAEALLVSAERPAESVGR